MKNRLEIIEDVYIVDFQHISPRNSLDAAKIDYIVLFSNGVSVLFQLKPRASAKRAHLREYPHIPCLQIGLGTNLGNVQTKLSEFLAKIINGSYDADYEIKNS